MQVVLAAFFFFKKLFHFLKPWPIFPVLMYESIFRKEDHDEKIGFIDYVSSRVVLLCILQG